MFSKRRAISLILALTMVFSVSITAFAAEQATISVGDASVAEDATGADRTVTIPVSIADNPGYAGYNFTLAYDNTALTLNSITKGAATTNTIFNVDIPANKFLTVGLTNSSLDGVLAELSFTVTDGAAAQDYPISISLTNGLEGNFSDASPAPIPVTFTAGKISVTSASAIVDKAALDALIADCAGLDENDYTLSTWAELAAKLLAAQAVSGNPDAAQSDVDEALSDLQNAKNALEAKPTVDKSSLSDAIDMASSGFTENLYTPASWASFASALASAQAVLADANATQAQVDAALAGLQAAIDGLEFDVPPTGSEVTAAIRTSATVYESGVAEYIISLANMKNVYNITFYFTADGDYLESAGYDVVGGFQSSALPLVWSQIGDTSFYQAKATIFAFAPGISATNSVDVLKLYYNLKQQGDAKMTLTKVEVTYEDESENGVLTNATITTGEATTTVVANPVDKDALIALIAECEALNEMDYLAPGWAVLQIELNVARGVVASSSVTQTEVDDEYARLLAAKNALVQWTNKYDLNRDGVVNGLDLYICQKNYQCSDQDPDWNVTRIADVTGDGVVDLADIIEIILNYTA